MYKSSNSTEGKKVNAKPLANTKRTKAPTNSIYYKFVLNDFIHNLNSSVNIEILVSYLLSKLVENDISPHFPLFYGQCHTNMKKYTFEISEKELLGYFEKEMLSI